MKLLYCGRCGDVRALRLAAWSGCACGTSRGIYLNDLGDSILQGVDAVALGFANDTLTEALAREAKDVREGVARRQGHEFSAFVIPWAATTVRRTVTPELARRIATRVGGGSTDAGAPRESGNE